MTWSPFCISTDHGRSAASMAPRSSGVLGGVEVGEARAPSGSCGSTRRRCPDRVQDHRAVHSRRHQPRGVALREALSTVLLECTAAGMANCCTFSKRSEATSVVSRGASAPSWTSGSPWTATSMTTLICQRWSALVIARGLARPTGGRTLRRRRPAVLAALLRRRISRMFAVQRTVSSSLRVGA